MRLKDANNLVYCLQLEELDRYDDELKGFVPSGHRRWIEYVGWLIHSDFEPNTTTGKKRIELASPMGGTDILRNALRFDKKKDAMFHKDRLNSEIVMFREPENWSVVWVDIYNKTHNTKIDNTEWNELYKMATI